jgi:DNA-binding response OmpR family regulator
MAKDRILVADDNQNIRDALTYLLEDEGYELIIARDGAEALRQVREFRPELVFLDVMMPEVNGYDVCRTIKSDPELKGTYIIILTAKGQVAEQELGKESGADQYIVKPFSPVDILSIVRKHFRT